MTILRNRRWAYRALALALLLAPALLSAQGIDWIRANYTKYEHRIPMRDGKRLFTAVYVPKDASEKYPMLLVRTPYSVSPYGADHYRKDLGPSELVAKEKYIFAYQDVRGRLMSEGEFVNVRPHKPVKKGPEDVDESTDTWDTIEWLVKNVPNNNGRVGMWGISYPGFYAAAGMIDAHPALKAVSPQAPIADWFVGDDFHHNGAFYLPHGFGFFSSFGRQKGMPAKREESHFDFGTPDGYRYFLSLPPLSDVNAKLFKAEADFWDELVKHDAYDAFWQARNLRPHLKKIRPAVMTVGGWFDAEDLFGALATYRAVKAGGPAGPNHLVMGPWIHGGWERTEGDALGNVRFRDKTSLFFREKVELPFFNFHLKGKGDGKLSEATVFETGTNQWRTYDAWPPKGAAAKALFLREGGALSFEPPAAEGEAFDEWVSDPSRPVPYVDETAVGMTKEHMVGDQRFAATRPDVLVYQTAPLEEDVTVAGPLRPSLWVSTTGTDADWVVKLIDVYPDDFPDNDPNPAKVKMGGFQQLVRGEAFRGKFRSSFEKPEPFEPGKPAKVEFTMPDVDHVFRRGHRIMVQIQSTWFPLVDRNPQKFMNVFTAKPEDFTKATQRVFRARARASSLGVSVLP